MKHVKPLPSNVTWAFQPTRLDLHQGRVKGQLVASRLDPDGFGACSWAAMDVGGVVWRYPGGLQSGSSLQGWAIQELE